MKKSYSKILLLGAFVSLLVSCSSFEAGREYEGNVNRDSLFVQDVNAETIKTNAWINLMPNAGSKFFISGEINLLPSVNYDFSALKLKVISITQKGKKLFEILPTVQTEESKPGSRKLIYSVIKGISPPPDFSPNGKINAELIFSFGKDELKYRISDIEVEKVY
jgi:hypothetical protein